MGESRDDDARDRCQNANEEHPCRAGDDAETPIQQRRHQQAGAGGGEVGIVERREKCERRMIEPGPEPGEKAGEPDASRCDGERRGETQLPHVEKAEPVAGAIGAVDLAQKRIRSACLRKCRAEFGPHQPVREGNDRAKHPGPNGKTKARRGDDQRQGDERTDADHLQHVEQNRGAEADAAFEMRRARGGVGRLGHSADALTGLYTEEEYVLFPASGPRIRVFGHHGRFAF